MTLTPCAVYDPEDDPYILDELEAIAKEVGAEAAARTTETDEIFPGSFGYVEVVFQSPTEGQELTREVSDAIHARLDAMEDRLVETGCTRRRVTDAVQSSATHSRNS